MGFLPPLVQKIVSDGSQFITEQGKVAAAMEATAKTAAAAAEREAQAARSAASAAQVAADKQALAADTAAKAAQAASIKTVEAQAKAAAATGEAQVKATAAAELAAAREAEAANKAAVAAQLSADKQVAAQDAIKVANEKTAAAQELTSVRSANAMKSVLSIANKISAVSLAGAAAVAIGSTEMAAHFEKSTMLLVTAGGEQMSALAGVRQGILDISTQTGTSAEQMSEGMYIMEKAGFRGAAGLAALKAAAQGAKDENVDLATMSQAVTDVLLDYGYKMGNATEATDSSVRVTNMLVAASGAAKTTMADFAGSMSAIVPIASTAKISFAEVGGAIATMTQHGQTAQQSSQNLANLVMSLIRPNNLASAAMSQLGIDTTDLAQHLGDRGLSGSLKIVDDAIKAHTKDGLVFTGTMKDNANATKAMDTIMSQMSPTMAKVSQGLRDGTVSQKEYAKETKGLGGEAGALGNQFMTLYKANSGVTDSLKAGKPAYETYNAALRDTLGNVTAMRAAQMLLMNDGREFEANIKAIGEAGKKTGQDISTWADMQETLSVKMDQTKAMVSNLGIEMGTKLLPVAKDLVGGFTDLFHGFEQGNPVLLGVAGIIGGALLISTINLTQKLVLMGIAGVKNVGALGRSAITMGSQFASGFGSASAAAETATGKMGSFGGAVSRALPMMGKIATVAGLTAAAFRGLAAAQDAFGTNNAAPSLDQTTNAMLKLGDATNGADALFQKWDSGPLKSAPSDVHSLNDAIGYTNDGFAKFGDAAFKTVQWLPKMFGVDTQTGMDQVNQRIGTMGQSLGQMVNGGSITNAAKAFGDMAKEQAKTGGTTQDLLDKMPAYRDALIQQANASHVTLSQQELIEFALGKMPQKMQDAAKGTAGFTDAIGRVHPITPDLQKSLDEAGVSADGLATDLAKVLDGMLNAGLATESSRTATANFNKTIRDAENAIPDLVKQHVDLSNALNATGTDFNLADEAGAALNEKYQAVMDKGLGVAKSMVGNGKDSVVGALQDTYNNMISAAGSMGIHGQAAIDLTRNLLHIPKNVDIKTWMDDYARQKAADTKSALDSLPTFKNVAVNIQYTESGTQILKNAQDAGNTLTTKVSYMGGAVAETMGMYGGGIIPGTPPSAPNIDNVMASVNGKALRVRSGEFITNETQTKMNLPWLKASNAGLNIGDAMRSSYEAGQSGGGGGVVNHYHVTVNAQTNANPNQIARELGWQLAQMS